MCSGTAAVFSWGLSKPDLCPGQRTRLGPTTNSSSASSRCKKGSEATLALAAVGGKRKDLGRGTETWLPDGYSQIFRLYVFGPLGLKDYGSATESVNFLGLEVFLAPPTAWAARNQPRAPENWGTHYFWDIDIGMFQTGSASILSYWIKVFWTSHMYYEGEKWTLLL